MNPLYVLEGTGFRYGTREPCVRGLDLTIGRGETVVLLGANGTGKSTLLGLLGGLLYATEGRVAFDGIPLGHQTLDHDARIRTAFRSRVGFLFQDAESQLFCATVREEIAFGPRQLLNESEAARRTEDALVRFELVQLADETPFNLSGGEKRRVALAAVLSVEPEVLLLDEPTSNLDPRTADLLLDELGAHLAHAERTTICATHDLELASELGGRCIVIDRGCRILADGPAAALLADHDLLRAANLISARHKGASLPN